MNFIIPKNYKFKPKLFGLIDYQTAILDSILGFVLYTIINAIFNSISIKIYCFIGLFLPILLFSVVGINHENILSVIIYTFKYIKNQKVFLYKK